MIRIGNFWEAEMADVHALLCDVDAADVEPEYLLEVRFMIKDLRDIIAFKNGKLDRVGNVQFIMNGMDMLADTEDLYNQVMQRVQILIDTEDAD